MRLHFVVEGQTEETFVRIVLAAELGTKGIYCDAHRVTTGRRRGKVFRGGVVAFAHLRRDLELWMKEDNASDSWFTTMVDLYRLPLDFPSIAESRRIVDPMRKVKLLEQSFTSNINHLRFVPYVQLHEFEALLFSDPPSFAIAFPSIGANMAKLQAIRCAYETPEHIDQIEDHAPSKQILRILPEYDKPVSGPLIAKQIGLAKLRQECHHFDAWLAQLEESGRAATSS
jgi:hypothetical protein